MEIHDKVEIQYETHEDSWAVKILEMYQKLAMLSQGSMIRELPVFGTLWEEGTLVKGVIDEIRFNAESKLEIKELKTRSKLGKIANVVQKKYELQVMIYEKLLRDLLIEKSSLKKLKKLLNLDWNLELHEEVKKYTIELRLPCSTLAEVYNEVESFLKSTEFPKFASPVIEYSCQSTGGEIGQHTFDYDEPWLRLIMEKHFEYLHGKRRAVGVDVEEAWKCFNCDYFEICEWRKDQERKCRELNSMNFRS